MKKSWFVFALLLSAVIAVQPAMAKELKLFGKPLNMMGYITHNTALSLESDKYDTEDDLQSFLTNVFVEATYLPHRNVQIFATGKLTADWIYDLKHDDRSWNDRLFTSSRKNLYFDDKYWQILHEAHVTWTPGRFLLRAGKQIVSWGETDGFRILDQINPVDTRRGFADVEFENTIIPIWLLRAEYYQSTDIEWLQELGIQFIFNPNVDFIPDQGIALGNAAGGIWAPNVEIGLGGAFPFDYARLGPAYNSLDEPSGSEGHEYGLKIGGMLYDTYVNLHGFYGRENAPILKSSGAPLASVASDGRTLLHLVQQGKYPRIKFLGLSVTRDVPFLSFAIPKFLKAHTPVFRFEGLYAFDSEFTTGLNTFEKFDDLRGGVAIDYKIKIPFINTKSTVAITPQFAYRQIVDYPEYKISGLEDNTYTATLYAQTSYMNAKLTPSIFWMRDINTDSDFFKLALGYAYTSDWKFTLGCLLFNGSDNEGFDVFDNKDQVFFTIERRFSK